jgi:hypothetical protein
MTTAAENNRQIMQAAWAIFRKTYRYPEVPFKSIGRQCFAWALRKAHAEAKERARLAAMAADAKAARIDALRREIELATYADSYTTTTAIVARCQTELAALAA